MKITVVYNLVTALGRGDPQDILADEDTVRTAKAISEVTGGELFELNEKTVRQLKSLETDFFFNCAYGIGSADKSEAEVADLLQSTGIPFSGSDYKAITLTDDKIATKKVLMSRGLPTPVWGEKVKFPAIVKPGDEHCSVGIDEKSIVEDESALRHQVAYLQKKYRQPVFVEEYIPGRELNVTVLGNGPQATALPVSEIVFGKSFKGKYKIVDFAAKWQEDSVRFKETVGVCPAELKEDIRKKIEEIAIKAVQATGCSDYTRVDMRLSEKNIPFVLEVNANPAIGPQDGATRSAKAAGYTYSQFLQKIIDVALLRFRT